MNRAKLHSAVRQYNQVGVSSSVESADPHRLIQMLMAGALEKITTAKGHMERGEVAQKGGQISWAISIIDGLRASLDLESGGEIAQNLDDLYDYMTRRLARANVENDPVLLDEVISLMKSIKASWDQLPMMLDGGSKTEVEMVSP